MIACLDTSPPAGFVKNFHLVYVKYCVPFIGTLLSGDKNAYSWLAKSTLNFYTPGELAGIMKQAGLVNVQYKKNMFGASAIHWGIKPA